MEDQQPSEALAHIDSDGRPHFLNEHLTCVASLAKEYASAFRAEAWASYAGIWHDLGKYRAGFQKYIRQSHDPDAHIEGHVAGRENSLGGWAGCITNSDQGIPSKVSATCGSFINAFQFAPHRGAN